MKTTLRIIGLTIIALGIRQTVAGAGPLTCYGTCTVTCPSGATYYYSTRNYDCCDKIVSACADGGQATWYPGYVWECYSEDPLICP
jgi:heterodisulfide reductase subunit C